MGQTLAGGDEGRRVQRLLASCSAHGYKQFLVGICGVDLALQVAARLHLRPLGNLHAEGRRCQT